MKIPRRVDRTPLQLETALGRRPLRGLNILNDKYDKNDNCFYWSTNAVIGSHLYVSAYGRGGPSKRGPPSVILVMGSRLEYRF